MKTNNMLFIETLLGAVLSVLAVVNITTMSTAYDTKTILKHYISSNDIILKERTIRIETKLHQYTIITFFEYDKGNLIIDNVVAFGLNETYEGGVPPIVYYGSYKSIIKKARNKWFTHFQPSFFKDTTKEERKQLIIKLKLLAYKKLFKIIKQGR